MTPIEIKDEWVKRLRSGDYKQGAGILNSSEAYCCLGVLCEIAVEQGVCRRDEPVFLRPFTNGMATPYVCDEGEIKSSLSSLPDMVSEWAGVSDLGEFNSDHWQIHEKLSDLNDAAGFTFDQIADMIEYFFNEARE